MKLLPFSLLLFLSGCATSFTPHGIPNLAEVDAGFARGGQPTAEGWIWLKAHGYTNVIRLSPGVDTEAINLGMQFQSFPISTWDQITGARLGDSVPKAAAAISPGSYLHCRWGKNRTGTVVGYYRRTHGWTKAEAKKEMLQHSWGDSLPGLKWWWREKVK